MQLGETNLAFKIAFFITVTLVLVSELAEGAYEDSCSVYYDFSGNGNGKYDDAIAQGVTWTTNPPVTGTEPCKMRGVIAMVPPANAQSVEIALTFSEDAKTEGWLFNLGDSPHNNGYGGDGRQTYSTDYDAEIYSKVDGSTKDKSLHIFQNQFASNAELHKTKDFFDRWMVLQIHAGGMAAYSDTDLQYKTVNTNLLTFGNSAGPNEAYWYLGINRVIANHDQIFAEGNRDGAGLCSVCIKWMEQQNLDEPSEKPTVPQPALAPPPTELPKVDCMQSGTCKACYDFNTLNHNSYTSNSQAGVEWTSLPDGNKACSARSVMKLTPPVGAKGAQFSFTFSDNPSSWVFDLGDSPLNNGYGQGGVDGINAEIHAQGKHLQVYKNTLAGDKDIKLYANTTAFDKALVLKIRDGGVAAFSDRLLFYREYNPFLFKLSSDNDWYLGLNRIIAPFDNLANTRYGEGLCSVCVEWNTDGNLDIPGSLPVPQTNTGGGGGTANPGNSGTGTGGTGNTGTKGVTDNTGQKENNVHTPDLIQSNRPGIIGPGPNSGTYNVHSWSVSLCALIFVILTLL